MQIIPKKRSSNRLTWRDSIAVACFIAAMFHPVTRVIAFGLAFGWVAVSAYRRLRNAPNKGAAMRDMMESDDEDNVMH